MRTATRRLAARTTALLAATALLAPLAGCGSDDEGSKGDPCPALTAYATHLVQLGGLITGMTTTADQLQTAFGLATADLADLKKSAPKDIADEVATITANIGRLDELFARYDYDLSTMDGAPELDEIRSLLVDAEAATAVDALTTYQSNNCPL